MRAVMTSFDGTEVVEGDLLRPDRYRHLFRSFREDGPSIARGSGLSYCNASAAPGVRSLSTRAFNRILDFDSYTGQVKVEPGLTVGGLLDFALTRGWYPPVLPGHPQITIGGCIGFNVHGKSQHHGGNFRSSVESLVLFHPDHGEIECSRSANPDLFDLTLGGFGLTGFVTSATLRLVRRPGGSVFRQRIPARDLLDTVRIMEQHASSAAFLYSWNDLTRTGRSFGHGIVYREDFHPGEESDFCRFRSLDSNRSPAIPLSLWTRQTTPLVNRAYLAWESGKGDESLGLRAAAFPINGREIYYSLFGRKGFREFQLLAPRQAWDSIVQEVESLLHCIPVRVTLGSLKLFAGTQTFLNFGGSGVCLTLDVPAVPASADLFSALDELAVRTGAIVNVSKDSRLSASIAERVFPQYDLFRSRLKEHDPKGRFSSLLRRRLLG